MKLFNYIIEPSLRSLHKWNHFKLHRRGECKHLVWGKISILYGPLQYCEECEVENGLEVLCQTCYDNLYCECGQKLEDAYGSPGDGFCRKCD